MIRDEDRKLIAVLMADEDAGARRIAAEELGRTSGLAPIAALAAALQDESKGVRDAASRSLCGIGGIEVARAIVEYITSDNITTRNLAAELLMTLGRMSVPAVVPFLQDPNQDVRKFAVDILGQIADPEPAPALLPLLDDPDPNVVDSAAEALGYMKNTVAVNVLCAAYEKHEFARSSITEALGKIGGSHAATFLMRKFGDAAAARNADPLTLFVLIESLAACGEPDAFTLLQSRLSSFPGRVRSAMLHALVTIASRNGLPLTFGEGYAGDFINALRDDDTAIKLSAAHWLEHRPDAAATEALFEAVGITPEIDTAIIPSLVERDNALAAAVGILERTSGESGKTLIGLLSRLVMSRIQKMARGASMVIEDALLPRAFQAVSARWGSADEETRAAIVDALFRLDGDRAVEFLDPILNDPDPWLRMHVIEIIAAIADPRAPEFISRFLNDDDPMVCQIAASALQSRGYDVGPLAMNENPL